MRKLECSYIEGLGNGNGTRALPFDTMKQFVRHSKDIDKEVAEMCSNLDDYVVEDTKLVQLAQEYLKNSHVLLDLLLAVQEFLDPVRERLISTIEMSQLRLYGEEHVSGGMKNLDEIIEGLKGLRQFNVISSGEISQVFSAINSSQNRLLTKLSAKKSEKLDKKIIIRRISQYWKQASFIMLLLIAASSSMDFTRVPPSIIVGAVSSTWLVDMIYSSRKDSSKKDLEAQQQKALRLMLDFTLRAINDVFGVLVSVALLERKTRKLLKKTKDLTTTVKEMNRKLQKFFKNVDQLGLQADRCSQVIRQARILVLQTITKPPCSKAKSNR